GGGLAGAVGTEQGQHLAGLQHPNIARLYDGGTTAAGMPYLVMEFVDGQPLDAYCQDQALDLRQRLALFVRVCRVVQAAHARLVVHCDLKPGNVLVRADGEPVLLDFGIARLLDGAGQGERTAYCTPAYAAPETLAGQPVGVASDVFGLGVILVELVAARRLEREADDRLQPLVAPSRWAEADCAWRRRLHGDLDAIAARACALEPERRYPSVEALADDVQRYLDHRVVVARQGGRLYRFGRGLRRHWQAAAVASLVLGLSGAFVWRLGEERSRAQEEAQVAEQVGQFMLRAFKAADPRERGKGEELLRAAA
ncbi:MAG: serine/threonine protein kinase, partial [Pseudoxanthomonas sp.]|nr:serine/threonine protein kinase [Pseudoxanthomonas sp.]